MKNDENYYYRSEVNQRDNNEDSLDRTEFSVVPGDSPLTVLSVADGMGGHEHGEDVSREGLLKFTSTLSLELKTANELSLVENLKQSLLNAVQQTSKHVQRMVDVNGWTKAGSTIVSAAIWQNKVIVVNLGDSPLFHYESGSGKLVQVTLDHSVAGILARAGLITEEMARYHERRGQLEFFLGADNMPSPPPVYERSLAPGDLLLLCSDGISGSLTLEQIQKILASDTRLKEKGDLLIQAAREAGETDNQTLILWRYTGESSESSLSTQAIAKGAPKAIASPATPTPPRNSTEQTRSINTPRKTYKLLILASLSTVLAIIIGVLAFGFVRQRDFLVGKNPPQMNQPLPEEKEEVSASTDESPMQPDEILTIEKFTKGGTVLLTKNQNGESAAWELLTNLKQDVRLYDASQKGECKLNVQPVQSRYEVYQKIYATYSDGKILVTRGMLPNRFQGVCRVWQLI